MKYHLINVCVFAMVCSIVAGCPRGYDYSVSSDDDALLSQMELLEGRFWEDTLKVDPSISMVSGVDFLTFLEEKHDAWPVLCDGRRRTVVPFVFVATFFAQGREQACQFAETQSDVGTVNDLITTVIEFYDLISSGHKELIPPWYDKEQLNRALKKP